MKTQIKQAPEYFIDENKVVYNAGGDVITEEKGVVRLISDGLRRRFKVSDLTPLKEGIEMDVDKTTFEPVFKETEIIEQKVKKPVKVKKGEGVIATIQSLITNIPITEEQILGILTNKFPSKAKQSMSHTVRAQIGGKARPVRMEKEKGLTFKIEVKEGVKYFSL